MLTLAEELLLLSLDPRRGTPMPAVGAAGFVRSGIRPWLGYGLAAGLLAELALRGRVELGGERVAVRDRTATGSGLLDDALLRLSGPAKPSRAHEWILSRGRRQSLLHRVAAALVAAGTLRQEHRWLLFLRTTGYPALDPEPRRALRARLHATILGVGAPEPRALLLLALLVACDGFYLLDGLWSDAADEQSGLLWMRQLHRDPAWRRARAEAWQRAQPLIERERIARDPALAAAVPALAALGGAVETASTPQA